MGIPVVQNNNVTRLNNLLLQFLIELINMCIYLKTLKPLRFWLVIRTYLYRFFIVFFLLVNLFWKDRLIATGDNSMKTYSIIKRLQSKYTINTKIKSQGKQELRRIVGQNSWRICRPYVYGETNP